MEKKSLLERTNSWKPFIDEIQGAVKARDYRKKTIAAILHIVDPDLSMWPGSLWRYLRGIVVGIGFPSGREILYAFPFEQFLARKGKVFENAPLAAIQEFNSLVCALFPEDMAARYRVDESLSRRRLSKIEESIRQKEQAQKLFLELARTSAKEMKASTPSVTTEQPPQQLIREEALPKKPQPLFSPTSPLDKGTQERIEQAISASSLNVDEADSQRPHERQVIFLLEKAVRGFQLARQNALISLTSPQFFTFKDLLEQVKATPPFSLEDAFLTEIFSEPDIGKVSKLINDRLSALDECFSPIIEKAERRTAAIREIRNETKRLQELIAPFVQKKDLKEQTEVLLSQLAIIQIPDDLFDDAADVIEQTIQRQKDRLKTTAQRIESQFREFILKTRELTRTADFLKMMLFAARMEFISATTPYPDLRSTILRLRDLLLQSLEKDRQLLLIGKIGLSDYAERIVTAVYETDVKLLRGELTARSLRLKDLRSAIIPQLQALNRALSLLFLSGSSTEKALEEREWLAHFLYKLIAPFTLFEDTYDPESVNILFRYWWLDLERFLRGKESRYYVFLHSIEEGSARLIRPIARTLDTIEKVQGGGRQTLYQRFLEITDGKTGIEAASVVDQWLLNEEKGLIGALLPQLSSISQVDQEPLIEHLLQIEGRMRDITQFAKALQSVKTFEPERIDSLLEVFTLFPFVESFDQPVLIRLQNQITRMESCIARIEEELIVELGLLDKKARMESGYAITNLLPQTLLKVPPIFSALSEHLRDLSALTDPYVSSIAHFLLEDTIQLSQSLEKIGFDQPQLFGVFQKLSVLLFHRKMLDNALLPKNFARLLLLVTAAGQIVKRFRSMEGKGELSFVGSLIDELDSLSSTPWDIVAPDILQKDIVEKKLQTFIVLAKRIIATSGLTERREAHLITGMEKVAEELSEDITYEMPRLSFVPGDLAYLWQPR